MFRAIHSSHIDDGWNESAAECSISAWKRKVEILVIVKAGALRLDVFLIILLNDMRIAVRVASA